MYVGFHVEGRFRIRWRARHALTRSPELQQRQSARSSDRTTPMMMSVATAAAAAVPPTQQRTTRGRFQANGDPTFFLVFARVFTLATMLAARKLAQLGEFQKDDVNDTI